MGAVVRRVEAVEREDEHVGEHLPAREHRRRERDAAADGEPPVRAGIDEQRPHEEAGGHPARMLEVVQHGVPERGVVERRDVPDGEVRGPEREGDARPQQHAERRAGAASVRSGRARAAGRRKTKSGPRTRDASRARCRGRRSARAGACASRAGRPRRACRSARRAPRARRPARARRAPRATTTRDRRARGDAAAASPARRARRRAPRRRARRAAPTTRRARRQRTWLEAQELRDDHALHLVRAFADLEDLLVAVEPRDRVLLHEAVAAVDLRATRSRRGSRACPV